MRSALAGPRLLTLVGLALVLPAGAGAQACGLAGGSGLVAAAGYARYDLGGGTSGATAGADATLATSVTEVQAGYRHLFLDAASDPDVGRATVAVPVTRLAGLTVCPVAHGGLSRLSLGEDAATILAGGAGVRVATRGGLGIMDATPYAEVRGLAATTTGTVFGADVDASGYSVGGALGVHLVAGAFTLRIEGAIDGFDDGLGPTPYPNQSIELGAGIRF
ncbi:MAG: hypothetical protein P8177_00980 [Gemmatimonadota bacterium]